jgi:hypothetical protein
VTTTFGPQALQLHPGTNEVSACRVVANRLLGIHPAERSVKEEHRNCVDRTGVLNERVQM